MLQEIRSTISQYLDSYGWKYEVEGNSFLIRFWGTSSDNEFHMEIKFDLKWINLTVYTLLFLYDESILSQVYRNIGEMNYQELIYARLAYSTKSGLTVCADVPTEDITETNFHNALDIVTYYSDKYYNQFAQINLDSVNNKE